LISSKTRCFKIAPSFTHEDWLKLQLGDGETVTADWTKAIDALKARFQDRFLDAADKLVELGSKKLNGGKNERFGFSILAIDFLVIESLQGFREGQVNHAGKSRALITSFLKNWPVFKIALQNSEHDENHWARVLYENCRCALHHSASTDWNVTVGVSGYALKFTDGKLVHINRSEFHSEVKKEFLNYLEQLHTKCNAELRSKFKKKMNAICKIE
jgi:hypothetical protein